MRALHVLAVVCGFTAACSGTGATGSQNEDADLRATTLAIVASEQLPIREVSGLGQRRVQNEISGLAIGDASATIVTFEITSQGGVGSVEAHDLSSLFGSSASQWEAVAGDGDGRVFVLAESTGKISVLDDQLAKVLHTMEIVIPPAHPLARAWKADENSRAEGMLLLANGHVLVAKEKDPPALIELAPRGSPAEGYRPELALGERAFPLPSGLTSELVATKHWVLKASDERRLSDISELAVDADGRLLLLSDQGRAIARIEKELDPTEDKIDLKAVVALPSAIAKPEGLTVVAGRPFVAVDAKSKDTDSLFEIETLP